MLSAYQINKNIKNLKKVIIEKDQKIKELENKNNTNLINILRFQIRNLNKKMEKI